LSLDNDNAQRQDTTMTTRKNAQRSATLTKSTTQCMTMMHRWHTMMMWDDDGWWWRRTTTYDNAWQCTTTT